MKVNVLAYKRIDYKVAPEDSRAWKCNWRNCAGGIGLSNCGICNFRGRWDMSCCPLFITLGHLEAKGNHYKHWSKIAEQAVGLLHYVVCGREIILAKKVGQFEVMGMETWMNIGKALTPKVEDILDCLKILHDQKAQRTIKTTLEDLINSKDIVITGRDDSFTVVRATIMRYAKKLGLNIKMKNKGGIIYISNRVCAEPEPENVVSTKEEEGSHEYRGASEEVQGG